METKEKKPMGGNGDFREDKERLVEHYQYPKEKQKFQDFLEETWRKYETEDVDRLISRVIHEHGSEMQGSKPYYRPGHIGPLVYEHMNMVAVESAFVSGLQHTKSSMVKSIQQRVDEINTLLRGVGGFNRQIRPSFSRSAVVYLEHEDPKYPHRQKVVFSVNLSDWELRRAMDKEAANLVTKDGRSARRVGWDYAVNVLSEIVSNTGLKPKYVKNDKNSCKFTMSQSLLTHGDTVPDEYFAFQLEYLTTEDIKKIVAEYNNHIVSLEEKIEKSKEKLGKAFVTKQSKVQIQEKINWYEKELSFYIGTNPDPNQLDPGLLFTIEISTSVDYGITKDKMQVIMTKYIVALSKISENVSMDRQLSREYTKENKTTSKSEKKKGVNPVVEQPLNA